MKLIRRITLEFIQANKRFEVDQSNFFLYEKLFIAYYRHYSLIKRLRGFRYYLGNVKEYTLDFWRLIVRLTALYSLRGQHFIRYSDTYSIAFNAKLNKLFAKKLLLAWSTVAARSHKFRD